METVAAVEMGEEEAPILSLAHCRLWKDVGHFL